MNTDYIRFEENFNGKLDQPVFTTIRKYDGDAYHHGETVEIRTAPKHEIYTRAEVLKVYIMKLHEVSGSLMMLDTGTESVTGALEVLGRFDLDPDDSVQVITLKNLEVDSDRTDLCD